MISEPKKVSKNNLCHSATIHSRKLMSPDFHQSVVANRFVILCEKTYGWQHIKIFRGGHFVLEILVELWIGKSRKATKSLSEALWWYTIAKKHLKMKPFGALETLQYGHKFIGHLDRKVASYLVNKSLDLLWSWMKFHFVGPFL